MFILDGNKILQSQNGKDQPKLGFFNKVIVNAKETLGGLTLMWTDEVRFEFIWKSDRVINRDILDGCGKKL